ncbi:MAG TPA: hypothetical protein VFK57_21605 [Vicinamibacterales bacterium]|nr:hypothetical protein [Vicinamibacterales bacterium]
MIYILAGRAHTARALQRLPPYPPAASRLNLCLFLGELHYLTNGERAPMPTWLTIAERGLYTGIAIVGAIGSGKTSACMYPYVQQLLARAGDVLKAHRWSHSGGQGRLL